MCPSHPRNSAIGRRWSCCVALQAGDEFTSELVRIHETIESEGGPRQPVCLAINRSDYMLHAPQDGVTNPHLLQVSQRDNRKAPHAHYVHAPAVNRGGGGGGDGAGAGLAHGIFSPPIIVLDRPTLTSV